MPAIDKHHNIVITALEKDGWTSIEEQLAISISRRTVWIDIKAENRSSERIIVVEVKGFENLLSPISYLEQVIGQYIVYRVVLEYKKLNYPLYLAVPHTAYIGFLQEELAKTVIEKVDIKLLVYDTNLKEIVLWQT